MNQHSSKEYIQLINCYVHLLSEETEVPSVKETVDSWQSALEHVQSGS
jgi:hypothetical protein